MYKRQWTEMVINLDMSGIGNGNFNDGFLIAGISIGRFT